jgi:hypothetical protein
VTAIKRRINFTGRKKIPHSAISVALLPLESSQPLRATASLDIGSLAFPETAAVVFEAYQRSQGMRFELGTVGNTNIPSEFSLDEIDPGDSVLFRLKVVETSDPQGLLLGAANRVRPESTETPDGRRSLFPVDTLDLGPETWRVRVTEAGPRLQLHFRLPQLLTRLEQDPLVQGIILPQALRQVLERLVADPVDDETDEIPWKLDWLRYCSETLHMEDPTDLVDEAREGWVSDAVRKFARTCDFVGRIRRQLAEGHS